MTNTHLQAAALATLGLAGCAGLGERPTSPARNVILIMTDDQGYGDFSFAGNPVIRTPNLDAMAARSARLATFYVSPVCTPTRAALMTGRHPQRTRAIDTWIGRAMMDPDETTIAEVLRGAGFATGIFGKWHLGDCYPMRAMDQGFEESLVHRGGGIGQPADPLGAEGKYTDPVLFHNGTRVQTQGYCTDVYFDAAISWMKKQHAKGRPFFTYLPTNAPHGPFHDVPETLRAEYEAMDLSPSRYPQDKGHPLPVKPSKNLPRIMAMIENVDQNIGKLFDALKEMGVTDDTIVIFLNDNGPNTRRFVRGYRGKKTEVYEGGVRSPLLAHWPGSLPTGTRNGPATAHYDVMPTILDACGVAQPKGVQMDGRSVLPVLGRFGKKLPDRTVFVQAHRGDIPVRYHNFMLRTQRYKLLNASGFRRELDLVEPRFELYDLLEDPFEQQNIADSQPDIVKRLRGEYEAWFTDVSTSRPDMDEPPPIHIGAKQAPTVVLTRQDWRRIGASGSWGGRSMGEWVIKVVRPGPYTVHVHGLKNSPATSAYLEIGSAGIRGKVTGRTCTFTDVELPVGEGRLRASLKDARGEVGAYQVIIESK
jgi:arylsulfatase A-like enzyme